MVSQEEEKECETIETIEDADEGKCRIYASLAFLTVVVVIGVPMWWKTTEVYRVALPDEAIKTLHETPIKILTVVGICTEKPEMSAKIVEELRQEFPEQKNWLVDFKAISSIDYSKVATPAGLEALVLKSVNIKEGDFLFLEWPKLKEEILLTSDRTALFKSSADTSSIVTVLASLVLQLNKIKSAMDDENKRTPVHPEYDIVVSVLNTRPDMMDVKWDAKLAAEMYIGPFLDKISLTSNYTLKTQWRYEAHFEFPMQQIMDDSPIGRHYAMAENVFPHMITAIEKKLGNGISNNPVIHLIIYIPSCHISPLRVYKSNGEKASNEKIESFISPNWGSVIIYNPPVNLCAKYNEDQKKITFDIISKDVMQIILFHIGNLLDIHSDHLVSGNPGITVTDIEQIGPRVWEYDAFLRRATVNYITTVTRTLQSLIQLLADIKYILINDDVGKAINQAHENIVKAKGFLAKNELLKAFEFAKMAYVSSEKAFFDASLLEQLYFPDEQKYAVYIPLFLPIMVPVVLSLAMIKKYYFSRSTSKTTQISCTK